MNSHYSDGDFLLAHTAAAAIHPMARSVRHGGVTRIQVSAFVGIQFTRFVCFLLLYGVHIGGILL